MRTWSLTMLACAAIALGCSGESARCGDSVVAASEECDDGNDLFGDGCSAVCEVELGYTCPDGMVCDPVCGDGRTVDAEVCDPTSPEGREYCSDDCTMQIAECGDATIQPAQEACDDGNTSSRDGCTSACAPGFGWTCDRTAGTCDASDAEPTATFGAIDATELHLFCTWMIGMLGGQGRTHNCGAVVFTVNSVSQCEANLPMISGISTCTVADFEGWTAERSSACDFFQNTAPVC